MAKKQKAEAAEAAEPAVAAFEPKLGSTYYREDGFSCVVNTPAEWAALTADGSKWADTPAAFGVETCPGKKE